MYGFHVVLCMYIFNIALLYFCGFYISLSSIHLIVYVCFHSLLYAEQVCYVVKPDIQEPLYSSVYMYLLDCKTYGRIAYVMSAVLTALKFKL